MLESDDTRYAPELDEISAPNWARRRLGRLGYQRALEPLLLAHYGEYADQTPAALLRARMRQGRDTVRGFLLGGFHGIGERLAQSIRAAGGELELGLGVERVEWEAGRAGVEVAGQVREFDAVISTLSLPAFAKIAAAPLLRDLPSAVGPYQGLLCVAVACRRSPTSLHRTWIADPGAPFLSVEQLPALEASGMEAVLYLKRYCPEHSASFRENDARIVDRALELLASLYPSFTRGDVIQTCVTRRPQLEPFWSLGASRRLPPVRLPGMQVYLCTGAQAYPRRLGADSSVILARETAQRVQQS
jgi:protoporphyrinogen oxidase